MNNLERSSEVRRQVENAAYNRFRDFPDRELTQENLFFDTLDLLEEKGWDIEYKSIGKMIDTNIEVFLDSEDYFEMQGEARRAHLEAIEYNRDPHKYHGVSKSDFIGVQ